MRQVNPVAADAARIMCDEAGCSAFGAGSLPVESKLKSEIKPT